MELLAPSEDLTLDIITVAFGFVLNGELITPGEYLLLYIQFHCAPPIIIQGVILLALEWFGISRRR
jgi:hypothetical protein